MTQGQEGPLVQQAPVNLYDDGHELVAVLPMPGLDADNIEIRVTEQDLVVEGQMRGPRQEERQYLLHEWHYGPFSRTVSLPFAVDATLANATFGNGVLTVALPKAAQLRTGVIRLREDSGSHHDGVQGHAGREVQPRG